VLSSKLALKPLIKKAKKGFRGFPMASIAFYGPDDKRASKIAVGIFLGEDQEPEMRRWFSETTDTRHDPVILAEVMAFLKDTGVKSSAMVDRIIGCPHEEGVDYEGATCPHCPFWAGRDRFTGKPKPNS
jgi:hypothetical protein